MNERIINGGQSYGILSDDWFDVARSFRFEDRIFSSKGEKVYSFIYLDKLPWDSTSSLCNLVRIAKIRKEESGTKVLASFLPFVKYNTVSDSTIFLKMCEGNFLRNSSSHFCDI